MQAASQLFAERALNSIPAGLLIAAFAWLVLRISRRQNSGLRFAVWFSALLAITALPFVTGLSPSAAQSLRPEIVLPASWAVAIFAVWILFASLAASRVMIGLWNLRRLRRSGIPLSAASYPALREALLPRDPRRPVTVCSSSAVRVPTAIGFFRPVILIPDWALRDLPADELRIILLHELAHIQRWDDWTNLAQKFVRSLFFFHPAVWWIEKRLSLEREMACDDAVLAETGDPRAYAECLVSLAEKSLFRRSLALAQAAISHAHETSVRLARILQADRNQSTAIFKPALAVITVFAGLSLCVIVKAPKLVAFQNSPSSTNVATASPTPGPGTQARVVPAMMRIHDNAAEKVAHAVPAVYRPVTQHPVKTVSSIAVAHGQHPQVLAVLARETTPAPAPAPAPAMFMVIQTTTFDDRGTPVWSVRVWRLTFIVPTPALATTAKST